VTKSHIPALNAHARIDITPAEVTIQRKCGRPIGSKDKNPRNRKEQNNAVGVTPAEVTDKIPEEIVSKIPEEIGSRTPEEVVDKVPEGTQAPNVYEISINYVQNGIIWNRNEIRVDEIFAYAIAI
jgi:tRNA U54 and U55 pseudouridine synthase Pus10